MENKRKYEISALNVIFCMLVIFIHIISYSVSSFLPGTLKYNFCMLPWRMSTFVVQGFILLSGLKLFLNDKENMPYLKYIKSRVLSVIVPYTVCFLVYYGAYMFAANYPLDIWFILKQYFTGGLTCHFYFIPLLLQFDLLKPLWEKIVSKVPFVIAFPFAILFTVIFENSFPQFLSGLFPNFTFMYNDRLFTTYLVYWILGCYIGKNYSSFKDMLDKNFKAVSCVFLISALLNIVVSYISFNGIAVITYANAVHTLYVLCAILFLFAVSKKYLSKLFEKFSLLKLTDKSSFYIYLYHMLVLLLADKLVELSGVYAQGWAFLIRIAIVYPLSISLSIAYVKIKNKIKKIYV